MQADPSQSHPAPPQAAAGTEIRLTFPGTPLSVRHALQSFLEELDGLEQEERGSVELVLAEVLNNVVEHAYGPEERGWISLFCTPGPDGLQFRIQDSGRPMPEGIPPMGSPAALPEALEALPEGGFGWFLIRDLSHDVSYQRQGELNVLSFRIKVGALHPVP